MSSNDTHCSQCGCRGTVRFHFENDTETGRPIYTDSGICSSCIDKNREVGTTIEREFYKGLRQEEKRERENLTEAIVEGLKRYELWKRSRGGF